MQIPQILFGPVRGYDMHVYFFKNKLDYTNILISQITNLKVQETARNNFFY